MKISSIVQFYRLHYILVPLHDMIEEDYEVKEILYKRVNKSGFT